MSLEEALNILMDEEYDKKLAVAQKIMFNGEPDTEDLTLFGGNKFSPAFRGDKENEAMKEFVRIEAKQWISMAMKAIRVVIVSSFTEKKPS